jgi:hypothetical protein
MVDKIRILTKKGTVIERNAELVTFTDGKGRASTLAQVGIYLYAVVVTDEKGPVFSVI